MKVLPGGSPGTPEPLEGPTNKFNDVAEDLQYQFLGEEHMFSVMATHIHESMTLNASYATTASANPSDNLNTTRNRGDLLLPAQDRGHAGILLHQRQH